jgi:methylated-DNA-[protein]-cysteine S-methyltransferase
LSGPAVSYSAIRIPHSAFRDDHAPPFAAVKEQLAAYFRGDLQAFDLPLAPAGTPFQRRVWQELARIPYGETISYGELARRVGNPKAARAVGLANGQNPLPIIVPCHRVIGSDGRLTGYGGGLPRKEALLALERKGNGRGDEG